MQNDRRPTVQGDAAHSTNAVVTTVRGRRRGFHQIRHC